MLQILNVLVTLLNYRYLDTLSACALDVDISLMVGGDMAFIGDKGVNLSGGQRARLALARFLLSLISIFSPSLAMFLMILCAHNINQTGLFIMIQTCIFLMMY